MRREFIMIAAMWVAAPVLFAAPQMTCPVMGGKINPKLYVDAGGYRIYVCCGGCIAAIKADPQQFIDKMRAEGVELEKAPAAPKK